MGTNVLRIKALWTEASMCGRKVRHVESHATTTLTVYGLQRSSPEDVTDIQAHDDGLELPPRQRRKRVSHTALHT